MAFVCPSLQTKVIVPRLLCTAVVYSSQSVVVVCIRKQIVHHMERVVGRNGSS